MEKKFDESSMQEAMRLAKSDAGRQLLAMLRSRHGDAINAALDSAKAGDVEKTKQALAAFMSDPKTQALLKQLQEERNG